MWPFNGKAWWVGEGKGLKPHVYADFSHGVTNTLFMVMTMTKCLTQ